MTPSPDACNGKKNPMRHVRKWFHKAKSDKSDLKSSATVVGEGECVTTTHNLKKKLAGESSQSKKVANNDPGDAASLGDSSQTPAEQSKPQALSSDHLDAIVEQANLLKKRNQILQPLYLRSTSGQTGSGTRPTKTFGRLMKDF
jgi:V8-like Glu-specific endopeptidase